MNKIREWIPGLFIIGKMAEDRKTGLEEMAFDAADEPAVVSKWA